MASGIALMPSAMGRKIVGRMKGSKEAPIFSAPANQRSSTGPLVCWFTEPPGVVFQLTEPARMTSVMASWVTGPAFNAMVEHFPASRSFIFVIDLRAMNEREPGVREIFMTLARESGPLLSASIIIPPRHANPLYLGALKSASALLAPFGAKLEVTGDLPAVLQRYQLRPART